MPADTHRTLVVLLALSFAWLIAGCKAQSDEELFRKLTVHAEAGSAEAQYNLGMFYNNGIGTAQNPKLAFEWFEKAAKAGEPLGSYKVGCYYGGQFQGVVPVDGDKALAFKLSAAQAGYMLAQHDVAIAYTERGDSEEAAKWWRMAAEQGDVAALVVLADAHKRGVGVALDPLKAYEYLFMASRLVPESQIRQAAPFLDELKKSIEPSAAAGIEKAAAQWAPQPTELTIRAQSGIEEARRIAQ